MKKVSYVRIFVYEEDKILEGYIMQSAFKLKCVLVNALRLSCLSLILFTSTGGMADGIPEVSRKKIRASDVKKQSGGNNENKLQSYSLPESELAKYQYCGKDSDCIQVINGCCQCMQGDPFTTINRDMRMEFKKRFTCEKVTCPEDIKTFSCHDGVVSCINYRCQYYPPD